MFSVSTRFSKTSQLALPRILPPPRNGVSSLSRSSQVLRSQRFLSTQTGTSEYPDEGKGYQEVKTEEPRHQRLDGPGGQPYVAGRNKGFTPILAGLFTVGVGLTAYGLWEVYSIMHMWPQDIRADLRAGLLAKRKGDLSIAAQYLYRAWQQTKTLPLSDFGPDPLLKTTGIGITLGGILEQAGALAEAYDIYEDVFWTMRTAHLPKAKSTTKVKGAGPEDGEVEVEVEVEGGLPPSTRDTRPDLGVETLKGMTNADKMRAVALSYKLSELAHALKRPRAEEERWLVWSVEAILRTIIDNPPVAAVEVVHTVGQGEGAGRLGAMRGGEDAGRPEVKVLVEQLGLPVWVMRHDIAAPFEALGTFYAEEGNVPFALPLYLQAIAILIPPAPTVTPVEDKCRGAQLMGNITELLVRNLTRATATLEATSQAEAWARKGLETVMAARKASPIRHDVCEEALVALLYNVAMVRELAGDEPRARALLSESLEQARKIDMQEGIQHASEALKRLDTGADTVKPVVVDRLVDNKDV